MTILRSAAKIKTQYHTAISNYQQLAWSIENKDSFAWAKGGPLETKVKESADAIQKHLNDWSHEFFLTADIKTTKARYSASTITSECDKLTKHAKPAVDKLIAITGSILRAGEEFEKASNA